VHVAPEGTPSKLYTKKIDLEGTVPISFNAPLDADLFQAVVELSEVERRSEAYELKPSIVIPEQYSSIFSLVAFKPANVKVRKDK